MLHLTAKAKAVPHRGRMLALGAIVAAATMILAACGGDNDETSASGDSELIVMGLSFPCGLNDFATKLCNGAEAEGEALSGYDVEIKTGIDFQDNVAFNNLIQTSMQLDPAGLIIFPAGPAAQTPILNQACDQGVEVVIIDGPAEGVKCQSSFVGQDSNGLGVLLGEWLVDNPPASKEVGVVTFPPGAVSSADTIVSAFTETVEEGGLEIAATAATDNERDETRNKVENMITGNPNLGAVFSQNSPMAQGSAQALKDNDDILHLTKDGAPEDIQRIVDGEMAAVASQHPYAMGVLAVRVMAAVLEGEEVPEVVFTPQALVDETNAQEFFDRGGLGEQDIPEGIPDGPAENVKIGS